MLREAAAAHGIDLSLSWMIGDKAIDIECGQNAGCQTIQVRTGYGLHQSDSKADFIVDNVTLGLELIFEQHSSQNPEAK
jgi:D-glycero-D-manno-heptose 1,7-bisphosphate phosphatase